MSDKLFSKKNIKILEHYRSSKDFDAKEKNLINQMIANKKYIPFFDISIDEINDKTINVDIRRKSVISKPQRIQFAIDNGFRLIVFDSVDGMIPRVVLDGEMDESDEDIAEYKQFLKKEYKYLIRKLPVGI